ncbi:hypothetical protein [Schaalia sp. Marseille-Q2122]|uniref:hypothetical protein n=1 Tax=Schaalia sp. Marseille-Q2122 TaxID=2736604 RepID=UPI00158D4959|nr:hypothetical protein [Schaalia sp. Marseille-Q2122]
MKKQGGYGKNFSALALPAGGICAVSGGLLMFGGEAAFPIWAVDTFGYLTLTFAVATGLGFLPVPLPRWMYPEYHLARRERIRAERLARGEVVKMPSSGRVAVEAQRLEQIVREQEAAQRADKDESSR